MFNASKLRLIVIGAVLSLLALSCSSPAGSTDSGRPDTREATDVSSSDAASPDAEDADAFDSAQDDTSGADVYSPPEPLDILFVGNSFTFGGPVPEVVEYLAVDAGWPQPNVVWSAFGGESLAGHRQREATLEKVDRGGWEVVVLQELSTRPTDNRGDPERFKADATWFHDRIKASSPDARVVLFETWARHPDHGIYPLGFDDPAQMQSQLREHYFDCAERHIPEFAGASVEPQVEVAPVGDAWEAHLDERDSVRLHADDDYHAATAGQYLNGLVIYGTIFRRATSGRASWEVSRTDAARLQASADGVTGYAQTGGPTGGPVLEPGLAQGQVVRVDFGGEPTLASGWNALERPLDGTLVNAVDSDGETTAVDVRVSDAFSGTNEMGPDATQLDYPADVTGDTFWVGSFDGHETALAFRGAVTISGLEPEASYRLSLYAGRTGDDGGRGRLTRYVVGEEARHLEVADNLDEVVELGSARADPAGQLTVTVSVSPDGGSRFGYLGALEIEGQ